MKMGQASGECACLPSFFLRGISSLFRSISTVLTWHQKCTCPGLPLASFLIFGKLLNPFSMPYFLHCKMNTNNILPRVVQSKGEQTSLQAKTTLPTVCLNKDLLEHSQAHLFTYCPWLFLMLQWQRLVAATELQKPKRVPIQLFIESLLTPGLRIK